MKETTENRLLRFIKQENMYPKLKDFLAQQEVKQEDPETLEIKNLLGSARAAGASRGDSEALKEKFIAFMQEQDGGTDETVGVHIDAIVEAQRGVKKEKDSSGKLLPAWKQAQGATRNWLSSRSKDTKDSKAIVGMVTGKEATYYYKDVEPVATASTGTRAKKKATATA